jgi:glycosyltransferase involved in cell wall biosynthesis
VQRYAFEILHALDEYIGKFNNRNIELIILAPINIKYEPRFKCIKLRIVGKTKGHLWEQFELPFYCKDNLLLNFCNTGPIIKKNQIVTIHDAAVFANPKNFSFAFRTWYQILLRLLTRRSKQIITVSNFSCNELHKYCKVKSNLQVIPGSKEQILRINSDNTILEKHGLNKYEYVLAVSSMNPNKNFFSVIKAINQLKDVECTFVIAGGKNSRVFESVDLPVENNVIYVGYVNDAELKSLYENALCFVFPSFYEGFGLPPLEAMACGCPVVVSNTASLPEVCGDAALYCDPHDVGDIAEKIKILVLDPGLRETMRQRSIERANQFTWEHSAVKLLTLIEEKVENGTNHG